MQQCLITREENQVLQTQRIKLATQLLFFLSEIGLFPQHPIILYEYHRRNSTLHPISKSFSNPSVLEVLHWQNFQSLKNTKMYSVLNFPNFACILLHPFKFSLVRRDSTSQLVNQTLVLRIKIRVIQLIRKWKKYYVTYVTDHDLLSQTDLITENWIVAVSCLWSLNEYKNSKSLTNEKF